MIVHIYYRSFHHSVLSTGKCLQDQNMVDGWQDGQQLSIYSYHFISIHPTLLLPRICRGVSFAYHLRGVFFLGQSLTSQLPGKLAQSENLVHKRGTGTQCASECSSHLLFKIFVHHLPIVLLQYFLPSIDHCEKDLFMVAACRNLGDLTPNHYKNQRSNRDNQYRIIHICCSQKHRNCSSPSVAIS